MNFARLLAAPAAVVLIGAAPLPAVYVSPAGQRVAGIPNPAEPYDVILPSGRIVAPVGHSVAVGTNALGVALTPDGKFAMVSNDDETAGGGAASGVRAGYSLAVVNTATMTLTDVYASGAAQFFLGIAAVRDPADPRSTLVVASGGGSDDVRFFHLDEFGKLQEAG